MASTVEVTSIPLPEVLVAEFRMAFTASWIAAFWLELVELDVLDSPRSSASDSVLLGLKADRSELMPLVLITLLLCAAVARCRRQSRYRADTENSSALYLLSAIRKTS
jgi:hypothetical protein